LRKGTRIQVAKEWHTESSTQQMASNKGHGPIRFFLSFAGELPIPLPIHWGLDSLLKIQKFENLHQSMDYFF
jgi:hypothetical protein